MRHNRTNIIAIAASVALLFAGLFTAHADSPDLLIGAFSSDAARGGMPSGWNPWILKNVKRQSSYALVGDAGGSVRAAADASASGLMRNITVNPGEYPILQWRWKVAGILEKADVSRKESNDSPARVYVSFAYDIDKVGLFERIKYSAAKRIYSDALPLRAISYTWGNTTPKETIVPMPYTGWFKQVVIENATSPINKWITEERDVYQDYRNAFGEDPANITGVAIMTNTDNLGGQATAWYGDILFKQKSR